MAQLIIDTKPINFYVYSSLLIVGLFGFGFLASLISNDMNEQTTRVVVACCFVIFLSYIIRFSLARNIPSLRKRISEEIDNDKAFSIIMGGLFWGLGNFIAVGATFYYTLFLW
jgi:threonine/homoserine/homoserine lactone efflux protein